VTRSVRCRRQNEKCSGRIGGERLSINMALKRLATLPTAFLAGIVAPVGYHAFEIWAEAHQLALRQSSGLVGYGVFVVVPFMFCVIGMDPQRWEPNYWFSDSGKADMRRMWIRWGVYFVGGMIGYSMT
jgi:hypothetical protein